MTLNSIPITSYYVLHRHAHQGGRSICLIYPEYVYGRHMAIYSRAIGKLCSNKLALLHSQEKLTMNYECVSKAWCSCIGCCWIR